jgi:hypothetical protein
MKRWFVFAAAAGVGLFGRPAHAEFGNAGDVAFSADRLMGFWVYNDGNYDANGFGFGIAPGIGRYDGARLGFDGVIVSHLTLGGNLGVATHGGDAPGDTGFIIYPRVGYVIAFDDTWGFWPRGGVTITNYSWGGGRNFSDDEVALTFEALFYASPVEHFAITFGPNFDLGIAGDGSEGRSFGILSAGIMGWI